MSPDHMHHAMTMAPAVAGQGSLLLSLFLGGLAGGMTHCAGMCGPFVISQTTAKLDGQPLARIGDMARLRGAALLPYHAGRITVYICLGAVAALFATPLRDQPWFHYVTAGLLILAGILFLLSVFPFAAPRLFSLPMVLPPALAARLRGLFVQPTGMRGYVLGLALGFLPCGFLFAALLTAAASGEPLTAALGMLVFGIGTIPALFAVGVGASCASLKLKNWSRYLFPALMIFNSLALFARAGAMLK